MDKIIAKQPKNPDSFDTFGTGSFSCFPGILPSFFNIFSISISPLGTLQSDIRNVIMFFFLFG
jgi:hypothetical protein